MPQRHETKWENWIRIFVERNFAKSSRPSFNEDSLNNEEEVKGMYEKSVEQTDDWEGGYGDITWLRRHLKSTGGREEASLSREELTKLGWDKMNQGLFERQTDRRLTWEYQVYTFYIFLSSN